MAKKEKKTTKRKKTPVKATQFSGKSPAKNAKKKVQKNNQSAASAKQEKRGSNHSVSSSNQPLNGKKISRAKKPVKITPLSKEELETYQRLLMEKLKELLGDVDCIEGEALKNSRLEASGDLSTMPIHMADLGTDNYQQEFSLGLMDSERKLVQEILDALKRIQAGTYGICEGTGQPISRARLNASPWSRYCVEYASLVEQGRESESPKRLSNLREEEDEELELEETEGDTEPEEEELLTGESEEEEEEEFF